MSTETLIEEVRTNASCPNCKKEINLVLCEPIICPECGMLVAVHKHKGGEEHLVHGMKAKKEKSKSKKPTEAVLEDEEDAEEIGEEENE
jgi:hypothetical protein